MVLEDLKEKEKQHITKYKRITHSMKRERRTSARIKVKFSGNLKIFIYDNIWILRLRILNGGTVTTVQY